MSESGSYREHDVIALLKRHLEPWMEGRDWRIVLADDYRAHKSENVFHLCCECGYVFIVHGSGATPVAQTPDTDLNEDVRRRYGVKESALLLEKMRYGQTVPSLSHEECMDLMLDIMSDMDLHKQGAQGYKRLAKALTFKAGKITRLCARLVSFGTK